MRTVQKEGSLRALLTLLCLFGASAKLCFMSRGLLVRLTRIQPSPSDAAIWAFVDEL